MAVIPNEPVAPGAAPHSPPGFARSPFSTAAPFLEYLQAHHPPAKPREVPFPMDDEPTDSPNTVKPAPDDPPADAEGGDADNVPETEAAEATREPDQDENQRDDAANADASASTVNVFPGQLPTEAPATQLVERPAEAAVTPAGESAPGAASERATMNGRHLTGDGSAGPTDAAPDAAGAPLGSLAVESEPPVVPSVPGDEQPVSVSIADVPGNTGIAVPDLPHDAVETPVQPKETLQHGSAGRSAEGANPRVEGTADDKTGFPQPQAAASSAVVAATMAGKSDSPRDAERRSSRRGAELAASRQLVVPPAAVDPRNDGMVHPASATPGQAVTAMPTAVIGAPSPAASAPDGGELGAAAPSRLPDHLLARPLRKPHTEGQPLSPHDTQRFVQRIARALDVARQRDGEVRLRLSPPELGTLRLEVRVQEGVLAARLEAETAATRNLLIDNLPALRERLAEQGIRLEQFDVDLLDRRPEQNSSGGHQQGTNESPTRRLPEPPRPLPRSVVPVAETTPPRRGIDGDRTINVII